MPATHDFPNFKPGDDLNRLLKADAINRRSDAIEAQGRLSAHSGGSGSAGELNGIMVMQSAAGRSLAVTTNRGFWARLKDGPSGSQNPYGFTEVYSTSPGQYEDVPGGVQGGGLAAYDPSDWSAYEVNDVAGLSGQVIYLRPGARGDYRGKMVQKGTKAAPGPCKSPFPILIYAGRCYYTGQTPSYPTVTVSGPGGFSGSGQMGLNPTGFPYQYLSTFTGTAQGVYTYTITADGTFPHTGTFIVKGCGGGGAGVVLVSNLVKFWLAGCGYIPMPRVVGGSISIAYSGGASGSGTTGDDGYAYIQLSGPEPQPGETITCTGSDQYYWPVYKPQLGQDLQPGAGTYPMGYGGMCELLIFMNPIECYGCYTGLDGPHAYGYRPIGLGEDNDYGCRDPQPLSGTLSCSFGSCCLGGVGTVGVPSEPIFLGYAPATGLNYKTDAQGRDITCAQAPTDIQVPVLALLSSCSHPFNSTSTDSYGYGCISLIFPAYRRCDQDDPKDLCTYPASDSKNPWTGITVSFQHDAGTCNPATMKGNPGDLGTCGPDPSGNYPPNIKVGSAFGFLGEDYTFTLDNCGCSYPTYSAAPEWDRPMALAATKPAASPPLAPAPPRTIPVGRGEVVVARYNEPVGWLADSPHPVTIYNKGPAIAPPAGATVVPLANFGREAGSYLRHIVDRYDDLAEWTYFVQGTPHNESPADFFARLAVDYPDSTPLSREYSPVFPSDAIKSLDRSVRHGEFEVRYGLVDPIDPGWCNAARVTTRALWGHFFTGPIPEPFEFGYGAQWAVPRRRITDRPREFWAKCLEEVERTDNRMAGDIASAWSFEMVWGYLFGDARTYPARDLPGPVATPPRPDLARTRAVECVFSDGSCGCGGKPRPCRHPDHPALVTLAEHCLGCTDARGPWEL